MKELINPDRFYFYNLTNVDANLENQSFITPLDLLQLKLPDPEKLNPMFFLNFHLDPSGTLDFQIDSPLSKSAEDPDSFYGQHSFVFPFLSNLTSNEIAAARNQMQEPTLKFREKIDQWAAICFNDPTGNAGLEFFRENLNGFLPTLKDAALQTPLLNSVADWTDNTWNSQILIGQAPIAKIWKAYRDLECISEEDYSALLKIKTEQYPKFEGRWPVLFYSQLSVAIKLQIPVHENMQSTRKSISVD